MGNVFVFKTTSGVRWHVYILGGEYEFWRDDLSCPGCAQWLVPEEEVPAVVLAGLLRAVVKGLESTSSYLDMVISG